MNFGQLLRKRAAHQVIGRHLPNGHPPTTGTVVHLPEPFHPPPAQGEPCKIDPCLHAHLDQLDASPFRSHTLVLPQWKHQGSTYAQTLRGVYEVFEECLFLVGWHVQPTNTERSSRAPLPRKHTPFEVVVLKARLEAKVGFDAPSAASDDVCDIIGTLTAHGGGPTVQPLEECSGNPKNVAHDAVESS